MSARASRSLPPVACSGAMNSGVPLTVFADVRRARRVLHLHETEVEHLGHVELATPRRHEHVRRLEVAVHQPQAVRLRSPAQTCRSR